MVDFSAEVTPLLFGQQLDAAVAAALASSGIVMNVKSHGALCDAAADGSTGTDDTAAVQAAIDAAAALGGATIFIPAYTKCTGTLTLNGKHNITFAGPSGDTAVSTPPPAQLIYTGTGPRFIDARSSFGIKFVNLGVRYTSASFTGTLIDFSHDGSAVDGAYMAIEGCLVGGMPGVRTALLVDLFAAIIGAFENNHFCWGTAAFKGRDSARSIGYSNSMTFSGNTYDNLSTSALMNAGERWTIENETFEGTNGGAGGMPRAYYDDLSAGSITSGMTWRDNWCGDAVAVADAWFCNHNTNMRGLVISGGTFDTASSAVPGVKLTTACEGLEIDGGNHSGPIDLGGVAHIGVKISGVIYGAELANHASCIELWAIGNRLNGGWAKTIIRGGNVAEFGIGPQGGETLTQLTNRATTVAATKLCGQITLAAGAGAATWSTFQVTNSLVKAADTVDVNQHYDGSADVYHCFAVSFAGGFNVYFQTTGGTTTETIILNFRVHSGSGS